MIRRVRPPDSSGVTAIAILLTVVAVLYFARDLFIPLAFAINLALILTPAVVWLQKLRLRRPVAVVVVMILALTAAGEASWVIFRQLVEVANELPRYQQNIHRRLEAFRAPGTGAIGRATATVRKLGEELVGAPIPVSEPAPGEISGRRTLPALPAKPQPVLVIPNPGNPLKDLWGLLKPILAPLEVLVIVLVFSVFLLIKQDDLRDRLFRMVGMSRLSVATQALDDATSRVSRYLLMQFLVNAGFGLVCGIGLYAIGLPYAPLWGIVVGIFRIVPYVGVPTATVFPLILSLAVFDTWWPPVLVVLLFATVEIVIVNFVEPWLYGVHTGISALALLLTTVLWAALWGYPGLILSTPLTVCVIVLGRYIPQFSFLHILLGDETVLTAEAQFYQRLLSMDDTEARTTANTYLDEHSQLDLYDAVLIPALSMAERDRHRGTLNQEREEFLFLSVKEMLAEFSEKILPGEAGHGDSAAVSPVRAFLIPASDEADEITAAMLAQLLEQAGHAAITLSPGPALHQTIDLLTPDGDDIFCITSLPPFAFPRAIALSRQLQARYPRTRMIVGIWGFTGNTERAVQRFRPARPDQLVTSLAQAVESIGQAGRVPVNTSLQPQT